MPQVLRIGPYVIYFWSNEGESLEPVHVHVAERRATANATKIWITSAGKAVVCHNDSQIPGRLLRRVLQIVEANSDEIIAKWVEHFGDIRYYC